MGLLLTTVDEDVLIYILSFLEPPQILRLSETCRAMHQLASLRIVWTNACSLHIIDRGYPSPIIPLDDLSTKDLLHLTIRSYGLANRWNDGMHGPRRTRYISGTSRIFVSDVRFVPGYESLLLTISRTIWSALSIWNMGSESAQKVCEWSPRGAFFSGFTVNSDARSEATIAIALHLNETQTVKILSLRIGAGSTYSFEEIHSIDADMKPVTMNGDVLALSDDFSQTAIWNWRTGSYALLQHFPEDPSVFQSNECIQVLFTHKSVLVVRARTIHLFPFPELQPPDADGLRAPPIPYEPLAHHSFGWVDGECVNICPFLARPDSDTSKTCIPLSILVRGESDDPWASDIYNLELYTLEPNLDYFQDDSNTGGISPYLFPPRLSNKVACLRGSLTCKQIALGRLGTAAWIQPRDRFAGGLLADIPSHLIPATNAYESLVVSVFPGSLRSEKEGSVVVGKKIFGNEFNNSWTSFDYDEVSGQVALGSCFGRVAILEL